MTVTGAMNRLVAFAQVRGLLNAEDVYFARNALLYAMRMDTPDGDEHARPQDIPQTATPMLEALCDDAVRRGILEDLPFYREQFAAHLMNLLTPPPAAVIDQFEQHCGKSMQAATTWFYGLCRASDYIRVDQIARNVAFTSDSPYGELEITINLSKPEKDPREIAMEKEAPSVGYPACMLCIENEGYAGRPGYPSHETLRTVPVALHGERWRFQYSPYSYYSEHCIVLNEAHTPMSISRRTFTLLFSFVDRFPHYFIGSNADLPIVGGSILNHDHFQGGRHLFPMDKAPAWATFRDATLANVRIEAVRWPMSCLRLTGRDPQALTELAVKVLRAWRVHDDPAHDILHATGKEAHNTITPILRKSDAGYTLQLVLRNNRTSREHPLGIFHPHAQLHHIKRENIGLIEVMGLFVLPGRLLAETEGTAAFLTGERPLVQPAQDDPQAKHWTWVSALAQRRGTTHTKESAQGLLREALADVCVQVLEDSGVYKTTPEGDAGFARFLAGIGIERDEATES